MPNLIKLMEHLSFRNPAPKTEIYRLIEKHGLALEAIDCSYCPKTVGLRRISPKGTIVSELWGGNVIIYKFDLTMVKEEAALFFIKCMLKKELFTYTYKENKIYKFSVDSLLDQYNEDKVVSVWIDDEVEQNPSGLRYTDI